MMASLLSCLLAMMWATQLASLPVASRPSGAAVRLGARPGALPDICGPSAGQMMRIRPVLRILGGGESKHAEDEDENEDEDADDGAADWEGKDAWLDEYFPEDARKEWCDCLEPCSPPPTPPLCSSWGNALHTLWRLSFSRFLALSLFLPPALRGWAAIKVGGMNMAFVLTPIPIFGCFMNRCVCVCVCARACVYVCGRVDVWTCV